MLAPVRRFFTSWRFASFMLATLVSYYAVLAALAFWPPGDGALARFAADFRVWCLASPPGSAHGSVVPTLVLLGEPLLLGLVVLGVWWKQLAPLRARPRLGLPYGAAGLVLVVGAVLLLGRIAAARPTGLTMDEFPGARIRTAIPAPELELTDQEGRVVRLADLRGQVVVVTAIYSRCSATCPMLFAQTHRVLDGLPAEERAATVVLAVTLDPEHDDQARLAALASAQGLDARQVHLLTGDPARVNAILDRLGVERHRDPATGIIDHSDLYVMVDRQGLVAYRFTLGDIQERWMIAALHQLIAEARR